MSGREKAKTGQQKQTGHAGWGPVVFSCQGVLVFATPPGLDLANNNRL